MLKQKLLAGMLIGLCMLTVGCQKVKNTEALQATSDGNMQTVSFPEKPVELIVPWNAGGVADMAARIITTVASTHMEEPMAVVNQAGAAGTLAPTQYLQEKADGYKLLFLSTPVISMQPHAREVAYTWDDFEPIIGLQQMEQFLLVNAKNEDIDTIEKLAEAAREKELSFGTNGPGAPDHIYATALMEQLGVEFTLVIYDDAISVQNALLGGHIDMGVGNVGNFEEHVKSGNLKILGTFNEDDIELEGIGKVSSMAGQGVEVIGSLTYFIVGRAGTPEEVIDKLYNVFKKSTEDPTYVEFLESRGLKIINRNPEELDAYIKDEINKVNAYFE